MTLDVRRVDIGRSTLMGLHQILGVQIRSHAITNYLAAKQSYFLTLKYVERSKNHLLVKYAQTFRSDRFPKEHVKLHQGGNVDEER